MTLPLSFSKQMFLTLVFTFGLFLAQGTLALAADLPCDDIVAPDALFNFGGSYNNLITTAIADCGDPFSVTTDPPSPFTLEIDGVAVSNGETYIQHDPIYSIGIEGRGEYNYLEKFLFRHQGNDYVFVDQSPPDPTQDDYINYAATYFNSEEELEQYLTIFLEDEETGDIDSYLYDDRGEDLIDVNSGLSIPGRYYNFRQSANNYLYSRPVEYEAGTYTMVIRESLLVQIVDSFWQTIREFFIKSAYAQSYPEPRYYTITFSIADAPPEPVGASSILFLPGIQASRLYKDGILGTEDQLWEPNINNDLEALAMDESGVSVNDVYTRDVLGEIFGVGNVYKGFLDDLADLKVDEQIKDFLPFAYDWRFGVDDIVVSGTQYENEIKSVIDEIERLADDSYTNKVTIIGHSNGGLLAKAIMIELGRLEKNDLIDKLVLVGSPQVGTPKAIGAMLHGLDQQAGGGIITDDQTAREVMKNMAGAYGLLPSKKYFELVDDVLVSQADSASTEYLNTYADVTSHESLISFLKGNHLGGSINIPSALNSDMLDKAYFLHESIDGWIAPATIDVFEIAGVGIPTIKGFEYREFSCSAYLGGLGCLNGRYSKPYPLFTTYGDETVVATSALAYGGTKFRAEVDLLEEGAEFFIKERSHANLTESPTVREYLDSIIKFGYQNETLEIPQDFIRVATVYKIIGVHSPVNILVSDSIGRRVGLFEGENLREVPGGYVFTLGDSKYVVVPDGEYEVQILGYASSTFSLTVDELVGETQVVEILLSDLPTNTESQATFTIGANFSDIKIDIDGDGEADIEIDPVTGIRTVLTEEIIVEEKLSRSSIGTRVSMRNVPVGVIAGATISLNTDQEYRRLLEQLIKLLQQYLALIEK